MSESEPRRRRGRPRVSEEERKRHTLTFRMRSDLRDAVEELAAANNRTLSEQVEYYVDSGVFTEAKRIYEFSTDAMSPVLYRCISSREVKKDEPHLDMNFPPEHREMLTIAGKNHLNTPKNSSVALRVNEPEGEDDAIDKARALLDGTVRGMFESFEEFLGPNVVAALQSNGAIGLSSINIKTNRAFRRIENRCAKAEAEVKRLHAEIEAIKDRASRKSATESVFSADLQSQDPTRDHEQLTSQAIASEYERLLGRPVPDGARLRTLSPAAMARQRAKFGDLAELPPGRDAMDDYFVQLRRDHSHDFSTAALRRVIVRLGEDVLRLVPKFAPGWPRQFADLPADTRSALIGHLQHDATSTYETLMSPKSPHGEALNAFRRMRDALLPRETVDEKPYDRPDEYLGDVLAEDRGDAGKRTARVRR